MQRPDYGIDAPGVIRNLAVAGFALSIVSVASLAVIPHDSSVTKTKLVSFDGGAMIVRRR